MTFKQPCITECPAGWTADLFNPGTHEEHWVVTHYCDIEDGGIAEVCEVNTELSPTEQEKVAKLLALAPKLQRMVGDLADVIEAYLVHGEVDLDKWMGKARRLIGDAPESTEPSRAEVLAEVTEYFKQRADVDTDSDGQHPNEEMRLLLKLREVLK